MKKDRRILIEPVSGDSLIIRNYQIFKRNMLSNKYVLIGVAQIFKKSYNIEAIQHINVNDLGIIMNELSNIMG